MKKCIPALLICLLAGLLAGCGTDGPASSGMAPGTDLVSGVEMSALENSKVTILLNVEKDTVAASDTEDEPSAMNRTFQKWEAEYGTAVEVQAVEWDSFTSHLATAAAADQMPDVVYGGPLWFPRWPANNLVQPLDDYSDYIDLNDPMWNREIMDQLMVDGKHYVAFGQRPEKFYIAFNQTKFEQAGETTPLEHFQAGTWNWTQFVKTAQNMTDAANDEFGFNSWNLGYGNCIYPLLTWGDDGKLQVSIRDNNTVRWLTEVSNLYRSGAARVEDMGNWLQTFPAGKDAMVSCTPEEYVRFRQRINSTGGDQLGIAPMPVFDPTGETESICTANVYGFSIASKAPNPQGAAAFIDLSYKNWNAVIGKMGEFGLMEKYLTEDEREALLAVDDVPVVLDFTNGIGNNKTILEQALDGINNPNSTKSVQAFVDEAAPLLEAELNEFYRSLG